MRKKNLVTAVLVASMLVGSFGVTSTPAEAKSKIKLSTTKVSLNGGASKTIKIKGTKKKVKWSVVSGKKNIKLKNKKRTSVKIVALKRGTAKVQAKLGKKKYICRVAVRRNTPAQTVTITKADTQTAKTLHDALNKGKALNIKVKGSKTSASKLMKSVSKLVGEYNKYDVVPQYEDYSEESTDSGYRTFILSSTEVNTYKYGLLLVKDIVEGTKKGLADVDAKDAEDIKTYETRYRKEYEVGSDGYKTAFYEATGIAYDKDFIIGGTEYYSALLNYKDGQTAKPKQQTLYYWDNYSCKLDNSWSLPQDYYYITYSINGKQYTSTRKLDWAVDRTRLRKIYDEEADMYVDDPSTLDNPSNYYTHHTTNDGVESRVYFDDITFHYEPLTVDLTSVNPVIENKIREKVKRDLGNDIYDGRKKQAIELYDFNTLSQAVQQYYIAEAFRYNTKWCGYTKDDSKHSGDGLDGIKAMLSHKWAGKCEDYARMEITMYKLFGIEDKDIEYIACYPCNHGWSAVRVSNRDGKKAWLCNNYGIGSNACTGVPRHYHDGKEHYSIIKDFVY